MIVQPLIHPCKHSVRDWFEMPFLFCLKTLIGTGLDTAVEFEQNVL